MCGNRCESPVHMVENNVMLCGVLGHPATRLTIRKLKSPLNVILNGPLCK